MEFIDLKEQYRRYKDEILAEVGEVLESARFINGPAVAELEQQLADYVGVGNAVGCSSGTDALVLGMMALGLQAGDEVIVPDFTFIATAEMVSFMGAVPVFADIDPDTLNIDPEDVERRISSRTKGIIGVSLYGQCAEYEVLERLAESKGIWLIEDAAQSFGASRNERMSGAFGALGTTSFFPAKPLGAYGDGGAVFTNDDALAAAMVSMRNHGQEKRYVHGRIGFNGRLDTLQAAILKVKLAHFPEEMEQKQQVASWYTKNLAEYVTVPTIADESTSVWAQYTVRVPNRNAVQEKLQSHGIPTAVHYPMPLHRQPAFNYLDVPDSDCPVSNAASEEVLSLPMHPFLSETDVDRISGVLVDAVRGQ